MSRIKFENVSLKIPVYENTRELFATKIISLALGGTISKHKKISYVNALKSLNFELKDGDFVGLIGSNGAGKSTLLRMISGIFKETEGRVEVHGMVSSLLTVGMGMDYELSGYENIFILGLILGMTKREIKNKIDDIICFSELGEFINFPVKTYSAGMAMRLSFSVATSIDPDILIIDEGIGTGDAHFMQKAQNRIKKLYAKTNIMVIASHDETVLKNFCNRSILIENGEIVGDGSVENMLLMYSERQAKFT